MILTVTLNEGEQFLSEKEMEGKSLSKTEAARWIGVSPKSIDNWERQKKIQIVKDRVPLVEVVRLMKKYAA